MKNLYFLWVTLFLAFSGNAQSYRFACQYLPYSQNESEQEAIATISIEDINNGEKYGKALRVKAVSRTTSKVLLDTYTDPCNGKVYCTYFPDDLVEFIGVFKYKWLYSFESLYEDDDYYETIQIGVPHNPSTGMEGASIRIDTFYNGKRGPLGRLWLSYDSEKWLGIVGVIDAFKKKGTYSRWIIK